MALSIVPVLLSLVGSLSPASSAGKDLVVRVVDKDGKPVAGVQVGLCPVWPGHSSTAGIGVSNVEGNASIGGALDTVRRDTSHAYFVRLGMPADPDVRFDLDRAHLDEARPTLVVPEHGRVILRLPPEAKQDCRARLRCAPHAEEQGAIWSGSSLPQIQCRDGVAICEFVGLGLDLEYEVLGDPLPQLLTGRLRGPTRSGELITFTVPGLESLPKFRARLVDEDSKPLARVRIQWDLSTHSRGATSGSWSCKGGKARTDDDGRVVVPITAEQARWSNRTLILKSVNDPVADEPIRGTAVKVNLPDEPSAPEVDLGELMLAAYGSPKKFALLDDASLAKSYLELVDSGMRASDDDGDGHVEILTEMTRRGGAELEKLVAGLADEAAHDEWQVARPTELVLRTALARMRKLPDPLAVVLDSHSWLDVEFPVVPTVKCVLANMDAEGRAYPQYSYHNALCRIEAFDGTGRPLRQRRSTPYGGMENIEELKSGQFTSLYADLSTVEFPGAGDYRARIHFSPDEDLDRVPSMQGRIVFSSKEFKVSIRRCKIELTRARMEDMRAAVRALDVDKSVPLVGEHWNDWLEFHGPATEPEEVLFRAGRVALPALIESLEDPVLEPRLRAWVLGMLWNIAGTYRPTGPRWPGVLQKAHRTWKWPSLEVSTEWPETDFSYGFPDAANQAELSKLWIAMKSNYDLTILP